MRWVYMGLLAASSASFAYANADTEKSFEHLRKPALQIHISKIPWENKEASALTDEFLKSYIRLFLEYPRPFSPYNPEKELDSGDLWKKLCVNKFKEICDHESFRIKFEHIYNLEKFDHLYRYKSENIQEIPDTNDKFYTGWEGLHFGVEKLKVLYSNYRKVYISELDRAVANDSNLESLAAFNTALEKVESDTKHLADRYADEYANLTTKYPGRLLLNKTFVNLIEGLFYKVERTDLIRAIESETKSLQETFLFDLIAVFSSFEKEEREKFTRGWNDSLDDLKDRSSHSRVYKTWNENFLEEVPSLQTSQIHIPRLKSELVLDLIRKFHNYDGATVDFLLHSSFQRAVWQLRDSDRADLAAQLEARIENELTAPEKMKGIRFLGGGAGTTHLVSFEEQLRCVYKPSGVNPNNLLDYIITNPNYEVAASLIDGELDLRMVPKTTIKKFGAHKKGSCQLFAENSMRGRDIQIYNAEETTKWDEPTGRAIKSGDILYFDWLIGNRDRNVDNYIFAPDGRVVLVDHSWSFKNLAYVVLSWDQLKKMLPSERVYNRLVAINKDPSQFKHVLRPWLSKFDVNLMLRRIKDTVRMAEKHGAYNQMSRDRQDL